ncbi:MAG: hypothetical protein ACRD1Q_11170 [Vicinamibacterales bacterium]
MQYRNFGVVGVLILAGLPLMGCEQPIRGAAVNGDQAQVVGTKVEPIAGSALSRVTLTAKSAQRLDIKTAPVAEAQLTPAGSTGPQKAVPYSAVLYDSQSNAWVYTNPQPLVYVRQGIKIDHFDGDLAVVSEGPAVGTPVVTVGAAELFGTEFEVGH